MARIRTVKPSFFRHELLQELEISHAHLRPMLVFAGLWGHCDARGRFLWKPRTLKLDILPFIDFNLAETLELLEAHHLLTRYEVEGVVYGLIGSFSEHQRISGKEAESGEKFPDPPAPKPRRTREAMGKHSPQSTSGFGVQAGSTGETPGKQLGSTGETPGKLPGAQEGKGREQEGKGREQERSLAGVTVEMVVEIWNAQPWSKKLLKVGDPIRKRIAARLRDHPDLDWWRALFEQVGKSDFLSGRKTDFMATLFWILGPDNLAKVEAGEYDNSVRLMERPRSLVGML